jgi:hypothetical protein
MYCTLYRQATSQNSFSRTAAGQLIVTLLSASTPKSCLLICSRSNYTGAAINMDYKYSMYATKARASASANADAGVGARSPSVADSARDGDGQCKLLFLGPKVITLP